MDCLIETLKLLSIPLILSVSASSYANTNDAFIFSERAVPVVLSAANLAQPQTEAPASVTIIDHALIKASGASQISELFRLVPGMQVGNSRGNFPVVGYQGLSSEFPQGVQVIIDGNSVYSPLFGGVIWSTLPIMLEDIERIEIVRGPNSASFGSNAFQGVVNITSTHASQNPGIQAHYRMSNNQAERAFLRYADSSQNGRLSYRLSLASEKNEGYREIADDFSKHEFNSRIDLQLNNHNALKFSFSGVDSTRQTQYPDPFSAFVSIDPKRDRNESSQFAQITWQHQIDDHQQVNTHLSFHHFDGKDKYQEGLTNSTIDLTGESTDWNLYIKHTLKLNTQNRLVWGGGATHESVYLPFRMNTNSKKTNLRLRTFGNLESRITDKILFNSGGLIEHDRLSGSHFSPRLTLNYLSSAQHSFRLTATEAFRAPVISEQYRNTYLFGSLLQSSTGKLEPETVRSIEAAYHGSYLNNTLTSDLKLFNSHYKKLINNALSNQVRVLDNVDNARVRGAEFELNFRPNRRDIIHASYAYTRVNQINNSRLSDSIAKHNFSLLVSRQYDRGWHIASEFYYNSPMQYLGPQNDPQGSFKRFDFSIGKKTILENNKSLNITLNLQLALDKNIDLHQFATADSLVFLEVAYRAK